MSGNVAGSNTLSVAELQRTTLHLATAIRSFQLEGVVCATVPQRGLLALQDQTGTILLKLPSVSDTIRAGDQVRMEGTNCWIMQTRYAVQINPTPLVNNDGIHGAITKSNQIFLEAGFQPLRLEWFQYTGPETLSVEYAGPGILRQKIPDTAFWRRARGAKVFQPGLDFAAYNEVPLIRLPDFDNLAPVTNGLADRPDLSHAVRANETALVFTGYLKITAAGRYTFYLTSDDGSRLYIGMPSVACAVLGTNAALQTVPLEQALADPSRWHWVELDGEIVFAGVDGRNLNLELLERGNRVPVTVVDGVPLFYANPLHQRVRMKGLCEFSRDPADREFAGVVVPGAGQVKILAAMETASRNYSTNDLLTTAAQVRRLSQAQASLKIPGEIRGVVIAANQNSFVLEDASGGVYIHFDSSNTVSPAVGQLWEVAGTTDPGDFSPVIYASQAKCLGNAPLPDPIRPTWDQLMNGSLDAEYVEIRGVVTAVFDDEMTLLTPDGSVIVEGNDERPLPQLPATVPGGGSLIGSVVRLRGCFTADWNWDTRQFFGGRFNLYPASVEVEDPSPPDLSSIPTTSTADLLTFNARASALQRTKITGQLLYARPGEYFVLDKQTGLRVLAPHTTSLRTGDVVEAVGFPQLGGPSPVLQAVAVWKTGHAALPEPVRVAETNLLNRSLDATLVQVEGLLLSDSVHGDERVLELQGGSHQFAAVLKSKPSTWTMYPPGSLLQLTGVYASEEQPPVGSSFYPFEILLNNAGGVLVLHQPSWWTVRHAIMVAAVLTGVLGLSFIWITLLHRKVEQQTAQLQKEIEERQSVERNRALEQERTRVARDLHDELGAGLTELGILGELGNNPAISPEEKGNYLQQLTALTRTLVTGLDEIVWAINPHYDSITSVATYFSFFADRFLKLAGIACRLRVAESLPEFPLDSKLRHGLFLAFKEALNNVVRHSGASEVEITIELAGNELAISVRDNGRGWAIGTAPGLRRAEVSSATADQASARPDDSAAAPPASATQAGHDGLSSIRERLRQLGGECGIESRPGQGTAVEFRLNLNGIADLEQSAARKTSVLK